MTAAAAYRAGAQITDRQTGEVHDYRRKGGIESAELFLPTGAPDWANNRNELWNAAEKSETRKNSTVAREFEVALPAELTPTERQELAHEFTKVLVGKYGFAADCAIHFPHKKENQSKRKDAAVENGDSRNHHAHILCSTRKLTAEGFTVKTRELDDRKTGADQVVECRAMFAEMTNAALAKAGHSTRVDHRSLVAQGIDDRDAGIHLGPIATAIERRGEVSEKTKNHQERQAEAAGKVAALVAIAHAQAKAAEQAVAAAIAQAQAEQQAAALATAQARELAISTQLTALRKIENDRVRDEALASIHSHVAAAGKSSAATGRALGFAQSDHAIIGKNLAAASGHLGRAVENARGRQHRRHAGAIAQAFGRRLERFVPTLAAIPRRVEHHLVELVAKARQAQARRRLDKEKAVLDLSGDLAAAKAKAERDRSTVRADGIEPRSYYHLDKVAARVAAQPKPAPQEKQAAAADVADLRTPFPQKSAKLETERSKPEAPAKLIPHEANTLLLQSAIAKQAQWDASLVAERALYLKELTAQAYAKTVAHVAEHQAHIDAKPMLFGRDKWEAQRQSFENRDTANNHEWKSLKDGHYPFLERDKEAVQKAVERRVSDKNPELAQSMPRVNATLQAERERLQALERQQQVQERADRAKTQEQDKALSAFKTCALKREMKANSYGDTGQRWNAIPEPIRESVEAFNRLPKEARPIFLERMRENMKRNSQAVEKFRQQLGQDKDNEQSFEQEMRR